jgi:hypothetical protein
LIRGSKPHIRMFHILARFRTVSTPSLAVPDFEVSPCPVSKRPVGRFVRRDAERISTGRHHNPPEVLRPSGRPHGRRGQAWRASSAAHSPSAAAHREPKDPCRRCGRPRPARGSGRAVPRRSPRCRVLAPCPDERLWYRSPRLPRAERTPSICEASRALRARTETHFSSRPRPARRMRLPTSRVHVSFLPVH